MKYQNYVEMPFKKAFRTFPDLFSELPAPLIHELFSDDKYVVRIDKFSDHIEIGFASDNWLLNQGFRVFPCEMTSFHVACWAFAVNKRCLPFSYIDIYFHCMYNVRKVLFMKINLSVAEIGAIIHALESTYSEDSEQICSIAKQLYQYVYNFLNDDFLSMWLDEFQLKGMT